MHFARRLLLPAFVFSLLSCAAGVAEEPQEQSAALKPKITISKETTYITKPLRQDGYPDYVAAINQRMSEGVTPENNAAVLLLKAFGPSEFPTSSQERLEQTLGIAPLPADGQYFVPQSEMIRRWRNGEIKSTPNIPEDPFEEFNSTTQRPWNGKDHPVVEKWIGLNQIPLENLATATLRPKCFVPYIAHGTKDPPVASALPTWLMLYRGAAEALISRAMLKLQSGDFEGAWSDLQLAHRVALLAAKGPSCIDAAVAVGIDIMVARADVTFLHSTSANSRRCAEMLDTFNSLPVIGSAIDQCTDGERMFMLDAICFAARKGADKLSIIEQFSGDTRLPDALRETISSVDIDWDIPLKMFNEWVDRVIAVSKIADLDQRSEALHQIEIDVARVREAAIVPDETYKQTFTKDPNAAASHRLGEILVAREIPPLLLPFGMDKRASITRSSVPLAFALTSYREDHGKYPPKLEDLVPDYVEKLPTDLFSRSANALQYHREGDAYVIYSVGLNGTDNGGPADENASEPATTDDFGFRPLQRETIKHE